MTAAAIYSADRGARGCWWSAFSRASSLPVPSLLITILAHCISPDSTRNGLNRYDEQNGIHHAVQHVPFQVYAVRNGGRWRQLQQVNLLNQLINHHGEGRDHVGRNPGIHRRFARPGRREQRAGAPAWLAASPPPCGLVPLITPGASNALCG